MEASPKRRRTCSGMSNMIVSVLKFILSNFSIAVKRQALIPEEYKPPQPIEPQPIVQPQGQFLKPPQPEEVRKRDLSVLDHLQSDVSLAYVDKKKHIF